MTKVTSIHAKITNHETNGIVTINCSCSNSMEVITGTTVNKVIDTWNTCIELTGIPYGNIQTYTHGGLNG